LYIEKKSQILSWDIDIGSLSIAEPVPCFVASNIQSSLSKPVIATISRTETGTRYAATSSLIEHYKPEPQYSEKSEPRKCIQDSGLLDITSMNKPGDKPYECTYFNKGFTPQKCLSDRFIHTGEKDERIHTGEKPFECKYCKKKFRHKSRLTRHEFTHTGEKPFECQYCQKRFADRSILTKHECIHTGEKPFECKYCQQRFTFRTALIRHEYIHTGEKPFECQFCEKKFIKMPDLTRHEFIHTGEKPFECQFCQKKFAARSSLVSIVRRGS
jgi:KRAB domain-containing zinc finger protein